MMREVPLLITVSNERFRRSFSNSLTDIRFPYSFENINFMFPFCFLGGSNLAKMDLLLKEKKCTWCRSRGGKFFFLGADVHCGVRQTFECKVSSPDSPYNDSLTKQPACKFIMSIQLRFDSFSVSSDFQCFPIGK